LAHKEDQWEDNQECSQDQAVSNNKTENHSNKISKTDHNSTKEVQIQWEDKTKWEAHKVKEDKTLEIIWEVVTHNSNKTEDNKDQDKANTITNKDKTEVEVHKWEEVTSHNNIKTNQSQPPNKISLVLLHSQI